jgi:L-seryl-tRNA(Ser) seleniumtransferase
LVQDSVAAGATVVFSGDKLLGGPQAGLVVGPADVVRRIAQNPLARALRPDKTIIAALEATLRLYRDTEAAVAAIPVLAMLTDDPDRLRERAESLAQQIPNAVTRAGTSRVGGGSFPEVELPTTLVSIEVPAVEDVLAALRNSEPPILARAADGAVVLDVRTLTEEEVPLVIRAVAAVLNGNSDHGIV